MAGRDGGSVISIDELSWEDQEVPDSTPLTRLVRLPSALADRGFTVVVRFPVGWTRPQAGHYVSTEEIYVLDGEVNLSARRYGPGDYGYFPAGYHRFDSHSPGALVLAWFGGPARWIRSDEPGEGFDSSGVVERWADAPQMEPAPLGTGEATFLRRDDERESWILTGVPSQPVGSERVVELFSLTDRTWRSVPAGEELPQLPGPIFCRIEQVQSAS